MVILSVMETIINYNGTEITLSSEYVGTARPCGDKYVKQQHCVTVWIGDEHVEFDFYCNDYELGEDGLREAFYFFLSDGIAYDNANDIDDFQSEFGYTKVSDCIKAYNGCKDAHDKWASLSDIDIYDICNWMQEVYNL